MPDALLVGRYELDVEMTHLFRHMGSPSRSSARLPRAKFACADSTGFMLNVRKRSATVCEACLHGL